MIDAVRIDRRGTYTSRVCASPLRLTLRGVYSICIVGVVCAVGCRDSRAPRAKVDASAAQPSAAEVLAAKAAANAKAAASAKAAAAAKPAANAKAAPNAPYSKRPAKKPPGPEVCADCHPDQTDGFAETGMGRSLYRPKGAKIIEDFSKQAATVTHPKTGVTYRAYIDGAGRWWQEETLDNQLVDKLEVAYIVGSGNHTRSYIGEREGELVELPLTWYSMRRIWDMSPGYESATHYRFTRPIKPQCIFCHNDLSVSRANTMAGYEDFAEGIGCTRCHGDATDHVAQREAGKGPPTGAPDPSILNPARLDAQGQLRICQQCHLTGVARVLMPGRTWDHYDPREPLENYVSIYVYERDGGPDFGISSHGDRLALSSCFKASGGQLSCTRCHDPHKRDAAKSKRDGCLGCHQVEQCGDAHGKTSDDCASCHMYRGETSDIPHVTFTDHFIRKQPRAASEAAPTGVALVDALAGGTRPADPVNDAERLAIAHAQVWRFMSKEKHRGEARRRLTEVTREAPNDDLALVELGNIHKADGNLPAAAKTFARVAKRSPNPLFRIDFAEVLEGMGDFAGAEAVLREALAVRPDYRVALGNLANTLQRQGRYDEAETAYETADRLAPHLAITANNRGHNSIRRERLEEAQTWFTEALRRDRTDPMGHFNLGTLALTRKQPGQARRHFEDALKLKADFALAHWLLGRLAMDDKDLAGAVKRFDTMIRHQPRNPNGYLDMARAEHLRGDQLKRREALLRGLMMIPGHPDLQTALNKATAGQPP